MKIINLTPHAITLELVSEFEGEVKRAVYEPSGLVARVDMEPTTNTNLVNGFPIISYKIVGNNLPKPESDTYLLVSSIVLAQAKLLGRTDCIAPDTNRAKRNEKGHIISVPGFVR